MQSTKIYTLSDPETDKIRYVGKTYQTLAKRLKQHVNTPEDNYKYKWIVSLKKRGLRPKMEVLEDLGCVEDGVWQEAEKFWIRYCKFLGFHLTNLSEGGGMGGNAPSIETRAKMSMAQKKRGMTQEKIDKLIAHNKSRTGIKRPPETMAKINAAAARRIGKPLSESHRAALRAVHAARKAIKDEYLRLNPLPVKIRKSTKGRKATPEQIAKQSAALKGKKRSPEERKAMSERAKKRTTTPEQIALLRKLSADRKGTKVSSETLEKMKASAFKRRGISYMSEDGKRRISESRMGNTMSDKNKAAMSARHKGTKKSDQTRSRISEACKLKVWTPEHRAIVSKAVAESNRQRAQSNREARLLFNHLFPKDSPFLSN